jgi:hypothetical protein
MYRSAVLPPQVEQLTCENASTHWHSQAPDKPRRAAFATQSATHFELADEPSDEVVDIRFDDPAIRVHGLSPRFTSANRLRSARGAVQGCASNATQTVLDRREQDRTAALARRTRATPPLQAALFATQSAIQMAGTLLRQARERAATAGIKPARPLQRGDLPEG